MPEPTLGEIARMVERLEGKVEEQLTTREAFLGEQRFRDAEAENTAKRVEKLEDSQTWAFRLLIGSFLGLGVQTVWMIIEAGK